MPPAVVVLVIGLGCRSRPVIEEVEDLGTSGAADVVGTSGLADSSTSAGEPESGTGAGLMEGEVCLLEEPDPCAPGLKCNLIHDDVDVFPVRVLGICAPVVLDHADLYEPCVWYGEPWSGYDDCGPSAYCEDWDFDGAGVCKGRCIFDIEERISCEDALAFGNWGCESCFCACERSCDPLDAPACEPGQLCVPNNRILLCAVDSGGTVPGGHGDPCQFANVCDPGLFCIGESLVPGCPDGSQGCCSTVCDVDLPNTCPGADAGERCVPWFDEGEAPPGLGHIGVCSLPP